jgi:uncharacterized membrane protein YdbT with pleckstrin-like domain
MSNYSESEEGNSPKEIPATGTVTRQSQWAWIWPCVPWIVLFGLSILFDFLTFGTLPIILAAIVIVPRYMAFLRTSYILTESQLVVQQGSIAGKKTFNVDYTDIKNFAIEYGMFGRSLGYTTIKVYLTDERMVLLNYVPATSPVADRLSQAQSD